MDAGTDVFQSVQDVSVLLMAGQHEPWLPVRNKAALSGPALLFLFTSVSWYTYVRSCLSSREGLFVPAHPLLSTTRKHLK